MLLTRVVVCLLLVVIFHSAHGVEDSCGSKEEAGTASVVTSDRAIRPVADFPELLDETIKDIRLSQRISDNLILFVHGRGKHPGHAFDKSLIDDLEKDYSARVIMFHWPSWAGHLSFPMKNARNAADEFSEVLSAVEKYQKENRRMVENIPFTLLTHSMGSLVLEEMLLTGDTQPSSIVFDTVVINASASSGEKHSTWVEMIQFAKDIYITVNGQDPTLGKAEMHQGWKTGDKSMRLLGKSLESKDRKPYPLADNAQYIDISAAELRHVYYLHRYLRKSNVVKSFFDKTMNGLSVKLDVEHGVARVERERIFILNKNI